MANAKKIIRGDLEVQGQSNSPFYTVTFATTIELDFDNGAMQKVTFTDDVLFDEPLNMKDGAVYHLMIVQGSAATGEADWDADVFRFPDAQVNNQWPDLSTGNNDVDIIKMVCDGTHLFCTIDNNFESYSPV